VLETCDLNETHSRILAAQPHAPACPPSQCIGHLFLIIPHTHKSAGATRHGFTAQRRAHHPSPPPPQPAPRERSVHSDTVVPLLPHWFSGELIHLLEFQQPPPSVSQPDPPRTRSAVHPPSRRPRSNSAHDPRVSFSLPQPAARIAQPWRLPPPGT